jgi:hypothetical protein
MTHPQAVAGEPDGDKDGQLQVEIGRLYTVMLRGRWLVTAGLWLTIGSWSLWSLRKMVALALEDFTWAAIRSGLHYHPFAALGLCVCLGSTLSILLWQSRNLLFGFSRQQRDYLQQQVLRIRAQGRSHPLWRWVCGSQAK